MKDRIKRIMDSENLTPARFADRLQINRAIISHILNGRNNPSLDVVTRILTEMDYIEPEWLLTGKGTMYKKGYEDNNAPGEPRLFDFSPENAETRDVSPGISKDPGVNATEIPSQSSDTKEVTNENRSPRKIAQIIIYYTDNTFEIFRP